LILRYNRAVKSAAMLALLTFAATCAAQKPCVPGTVPQAAQQATFAQAELRKASYEEMDTKNPAATNTYTRDLKDALTRTSDAVFACAASDVNLGTLQDTLAKALNANPPQPAGGSVQKNDPRYTEFLGSYGHNLQAHVSRPANVSGLLAVQFSINIECGNDNMLLVYALRDGSWKRQLRWQANKLDQISDAFGDFFLTAFLPGQNGEWRVAVAHGTPWCTSRFTAFAIDVLAPDTNADVPRILWHTKRDYSRGGDFEPTLKAAENTFDLRLNADEMGFVETGFERRVIYRYQVTENSVERIGPIANHARGFVEEWISAPWEESRNLTASKNISDLEKVHNEVSPHIKPDDKQFLAHGSGSVRACAATGVFQVEMNSSLEIIVPGKPGGDSKPLSSHYFHIREGKDGYTMLSAPTKPDPACTGPDLMHSAGN
jgi:hypothetical protein